MSQTLTCKHSSKSQWPSKISCLASDYAFPLSLIAASVIVVFISLSIGVMDGDDWTISCLLSGNYENSMPCLFVNVFLSEVILSIAKIQPGVNWFLIAERLIVAISLMLFLFNAFSHRMHRAAYWTALGLYLLILLPGCLIESNYTFVATSSTLAGEFTLLAALIDINEPQANPVVAGIGSAMIVCGVLLRLGAALITLPFFILAMANWAFSNRMRTLSPVQKQALTWISAAIAVSLVLVATDRIAWTAVPELALWDSYNTPRMQLSDYPTPSYNEIAYQLSTLGLTENDWWLVNHWTTADSGVFSIDTLNELSAIQRSFDIRIPIFPGILDKLFRDPVLVFALLFALFSLTSFSSRRLMLVSAFSCLVAFAICAYFFQAGRLPIRVEYPVWGTALILPCLFMTACSSINHHTHWLSARAHTVIVALATFFLLAWLAFSAVKFIENSVDYSTSSCSARSSAIETYTSNHQSEVFWWDTASMSHYQNIYNKRAIPSRKSLQQNFKLGGWTTLSPQTEYAKYKQGIEDGIESLLFNSSARLVSTEGNEMPTKILEFLRQHYSPNATMEIVDEIFEPSENVVFQIWRFQNTD